MKRSRFTEEQIIGVLREQVTGMNRVPRETQYPRMGRLIALQECLEI